MMTAMQTALSLQSIALWAIPALLAVLAALLLTLSPVSRHSRKLRRAKKVYELIQDMSAPQVIGYLRKIDPYVFEELVLLAFQNKGFSIKRNKRYSGDGGVDGAVYINNEKWLLQDKRYKSHVSLKHIRDFDEVCRRRGCRGLFVHTGKTGKASRASVLSSPRLKIVSGGALVELLRRPEITDNEKCTCR